MNFVDLTMPLNYQWMPDEVLPTSVKFFFGSKDHQKKGIVVGSDTGTCLTLPAVFADFRKTSRLHELPVEKLVLRSTTVADIPKGNQEEISRMDVEKALDTCGPAKGDALLITTDWGDRSYHELEGGAYVLQCPHFSLEAAKYLSERMRDNQSDLLSVDTALLGWPETISFRNGALCFRHQPSSPARHGCICIFTIRTRPKRILPWKWNSPGWLS